MSVPFVFREMEDSSLWASRDGGQLPIASRDGGQLPMDFKRWRTAPYELQEMEDSSLWTSRDGGQLPMDLKR